MSNNVFAIQFRMLEKCNADCLYCDTQNKANKRLSFDEFRQCVQFIIESYLPERGAKAGDYIDIEYSGGEITMYPLLELEQCIDHARQAFKDAGYFTGDGAQSNLVGAAHKIQWLWDKFNGNVTTSFDDFNGNRRLKGCSDRYADKFRINIQDITSKLPEESVYMLDNSSIGGVRDAVTRTLSDGVGVRVNPVFNLENMDVMVDVGEMITEMNLITDDWVLNYQTPVEPMNQIIRMLAFNDDEMLGRGDACPFVYGCASRSLCVEPNGDLYTCPNQAIAGINKFGNALESTCDEKLIRKLSKRGIKLNSPCMDCKYRAYCKGGCLNHAAIKGGDYDASYFCDVWLSMFQHSEALIEKHGSENIKNWLNSF